MRLAGAVVAAALAVAGCGAGDDGAAPRPESNASATATAASVASPDAPALVGEWTRVTTCQQRADALESAGLERFLPEHAAGDGFIPGVTSVDQLADLAHPCEGAVPQKHSHFFTADGFFGSRDAEGDQVDDGTYELRGDDSFIIGKEFEGGVTFHYRITEDDELLLDPVLPSCAETGCFEAQWAVAVAYPGLPWERTR